MNYQPNIIILNGETYYEVPLANFKGYAINEKNLISKRKDVEWKVLASPVCKGTGYKMVCITESVKTRRKKQMSMAFHRLLYLSFHGSIPAGYVVDHYNSNRLDNKLDNLCAIPFVQNIQRGKRVIINASIASEIWNDILNDKRVTDIAKNHGVSVNVVSNIKAGLSWNNITGLANIRKNYYVKKKQYQA